MIQSALVRHNRVQPGGLIGYRRGGKKGLVNDPTFVAKVKDLANSTNPATGKPYRKWHIAKELGVSPQTIDRTLAYSGDWKTEKDMLQYVSYRFWGTYKSGIKAYLERLNPDERVTFINDFIDKLFKKPEDRTMAKEALYQKLKLRGTMHGVADPKSELSEAPSSLLLERGEDPIPSDVGVPPAADWQAAIPSSHPVGVSTDYFDPYKAEKEREIQDIMSRYDAGEEPKEIAVDYGVSPYRVVSLLKERNVIV